MWARHIALSVANLDAWVAELRGESVTFLERPYELGHTRAGMIEGPSREALELVEIVSYSTPERVPGEGAPVERRAL